MFSHPKAQGVAVVCGSVSGNLEVIDIDCKYGVDFNEYATEIKKISPFLYEKLLIIQTKSNGYHIYYRCDKIEGNQKLANRPATKEELKDNPHLKEFVLICLLILSFCFSPSFAFSWSFTSRWCWST
jgi:hypothetical protein